MVNNTNKVLLHICCGPCTVFPALKLKGLKIPFDCYFYNPNISNGAERKLRYDNALKLSRKLKFKLIKTDDDFNDIEQTSDSKNCGQCYFTRLDEVFQFASKNNYQKITTTLLGSPYQNHHLIIKQLEKLKEEYKIDYVLLNFKDGFYLGQKLAREMKIYCQKFCGCFVSYQEFIKNEIEKGVQA